MAEQVAFQTALKFGAVPTTIGNLVSVKAPDFKMEFVDTTHHGLTVPWRTTRPTLVEPGEADFKIQMTSANFAALLAMVDPTSAAVVWKIVFPFTTPITVTFNGWLMDFPVKEADVDGLLTVECKIKVTGQVTIV